MTTKAQRNSRLHELADLLERVDDEQFDYNQWVGRRDRGRTVDSGITIDSLRNIGLAEGACGTVGCVAGWAAVLGLQAGYRPRNFFGDVPIPQYAAQYLGLSRTEGDKVFLGQAMLDAGFIDPPADVPVGHRLSKVRRTVSKTEVAKMLRMVAEGEVDL